MKKSISVAICFLIAFAAWSILVCTLDVQAIGPNGSSIGLASFNRTIHQLTGVHLFLYTITDWGGLIPVVFVLGFAILGFSQWIRRKSLKSVDFSLLVLGGFYFVVMVAYLLFEQFPVNYRPILLNGYLEASYPSSTTLLVLCVMPTALMQLRLRIKNNVIRNCITSLITTFIILMVLGRLFSGVHWISDIIGGVLLSAALVMAYHSIVNLK